MKNILIIADGILAKHFLERLFASKNNNLHNFYIITQNKKTLPSNKANFENFYFYSFDPTSKFRLESLMDTKFDKIMINVQDKDDAVAIYENLRYFEPNLEIDLLDFWQIDKKNDHNLRLIDAHKILSSRFMDFLPDFPVIADNIGLGLGEIMEVKVPVGSTYAYRHINSIRKKRWQIAMIYRDSMQILPTEKTMILPNDTLLITGEPRMLENVFRAIKNQIGQFPNPFGNNILVPLDMKKMRKNEIDKIIKIADLIKFKYKKLIFRVINPSFVNILDEIKNLENDKISIVIDYSHKASNFDLSLLSEFDIGLIITNLNIFNAQKRDFYEARVPILKIGQGDFEDLKKGFVLGDENQAEYISNIVLDVCAQLGLEIDFYLQSSGLKTAQEHLESLSKLFGKKVNIIAQDTQNPILKLRKNDDMLQFVNFTEDIFANRFVSIFSKNVDNLNFLLNKSYQLFIPKDDKFGG